MLKLKYKSFLLIIFCLLVFSLQVIYAKPTMLEGVKIMVDAGHGGRDAGTMYQDILEKDINLEISKVLKKELVSKGATVYMTRTKDEDLSSIYDPAKKRGDLYRRLLLIHDKKCDLYISIHINWYQNTSVSGAEVLYNEINPNNRLLAKSIMNEFKKDLNSTRKITTTDLYMYRNTTIPGVLVECGYLSNPTERKLLQEKDYQEKLSKSITQGIVNYLKKGKEPKI